jgi:Winged helix-turn helix
VTVEETEGERFSSREKITSIVVSTSTGWATIGRRWCSEGWNWGMRPRFWTCPRVADLIEREFGVPYYPGQVWKLLIALGWSPQRPTGRARERNERQIEHWKKTVWPALMKKPSARDAS